MNRSIVRTVSVLFAGMTVTACSGDESQDESQREVVTGYAGGCKQGVVLYVQSQFEPFGAQARDDVDVPREGPILKPNKRLVSTGWLDLGEASQLYPDNPPGIQGQVWYYVPRIRAWVADAAVRSSATSPARGNASRFFTEDQAAPLPKECELTKIS